MTRAPEQYAGKSEEVQYDISFDARKALANMEVKIGEEIYHGAVAILLALAQNTMTENSNRIRAIQILLDYGYGKPGEAPEDALGELKRLIETKKNDILGALPK